MGESVKCARLGYNIRMTSTALVPVTLPPELPAYLSWCVSDGPHGDGCEMLGVVDSFVHPTLGVIYGPFCLRCVALYLQGAAAAESR